VKLVFSNSSATASPAGPAPMIITSYLVPISSITLFERNKKSATHKREMALFYHSVTFVITGLS
jgi:hypothetical protein